ncbi:DUF4827 domain-containing protein [uncultured Porphyromonas sp.]|uniref:DUF4827 domain-containing protein n=1 Tax=uncultured Porphyromonas sp. TaxID=159274 RepID=UPI00260B9D5F|nr:DUF4827 domain-containing protein [uncultured Porphyromonas sp.]
MKATNHTFTTLVTLVMMLLLGQGVLTSCRDRQHIKSLSEMLRDEEKMIKGFIQEQQMNVQEGSEDQRTFDPAVWYKFPNGVYMQVLNKGTDLAKPDRTRVMLRMKGRFIAPDYNKSFDNLSKGYQQSTEFIYINSRDRSGSIHYKLIQEQFGHSVDGLMCEGIAYPLTLVGNGAKVRLLIPFLLGPNIAYNAGAPMYCEEVWYQFVDETSITININLGSSDNLR